MRPAPVSERLTGPDRNMPGKPSQNNPAGAGSPSASCSAIPSAQALIYQPELTHSVWTDVWHRKRSRKSLEAMLRKEVRAGRYVGYRLLTIEAEYIGISWPNTEPTGSSGAVIG